MKVHLGLLTLFILLQLTFATTINIPENYPTIQEGIDNSINGDTVLVSEGTYYENLIIQNKDIAIITLSDNTTLDGSGSGPVVSYFDVSESALLEGFILRNGTGHPSSFSGFLFGGGIYCESSAPHLNQLNISGNTAFSGGGIAYYSTSPTELSPLFTDPENDDFTLQPNSPCIDVGDPNSPLDPDGTIADMGAFYFDQSSNCKYSGDLNVDDTTNILDIV